jgi:hypothetical protein
MASLSSGLTVGTWSTAALMWSCVSFCIASSARIVMMPEEMMRTSSPWSLDIYRGLGRVKSPRPRGDMVQPGVSTPKAQLNARPFDGRMAFVPEGPCDRSLARSAWDSATQESRPVGYGLIRAGVRTDSMIGVTKFRVRLLKKFWLRFIKLFLATRLWRIQRWYLAGSENDRHARDAAHQ